jgi:GNAT superfamily N-acetyltransferase
MIIRRAGLADLDHLLPLFDGYRQFYQHPPDLTGSRAFLAERFAQADTTILLAILEDRPAGFTHLFPIFSSVACRRLWILNDLYVVPEARRQGVARALLDRARDFAVETGACGIELATGRSNHGAQRLYESLGYREDEFKHYELKV